MAVKLSPLFNEATFDANGDPASGWKVYTYTAGSTTPQTVYQDSAGSTPHTNPVILNARGEPPALIWLTVGVTYKFVLKDASDVTIRTVDNVSGVNDVGSIVDQWIAGPTPTYISATSFSLTGDQTSTFHVGRRIKTTNTGGTVYSIITASAYTSLTTITVENDSGSLDSGLLAVWYGILGAINPSVPGLVLSDLATAATTAAARQTLEIPRKNVLINGEFSINQLLPTTSADDTYAHDCWYALTQANPIAITTLTGVEGGLPFMARLTQSNAAAQRIGYAQIIAGEDCKYLRGQQVTFRFGRVRISNSQPIRYAVLEWTGTEDIVTSDVVNDWTSSDYTDGAAKFFVDANITPAGNTSHTPVAATLTNGPSLTVTLSNAFNNLIVLVWTEGTAAQNVTLDLGKAKLEEGAAATIFEWMPKTSVLALCQRDYEKSFLLEQPPIQNSGITDGALLVVQVIGASTGTVSHSIPYRVRKRVPPTITLFNPSAANDQVRNITGGTDCSASLGGNGGDGTLYVNFTTAGGSAAGNRNMVHWTAACRL